MFIGEMLNTCRIKCKLIIVAKLILTDDRLYITYKGGR